VSSPQSRGGQARRDALSPSERSEIARRAAQAKWSTPEERGLTPKARSEGVLPIGDVNIDCYVLEDRRRLVSKRAMARALNLKSEGGNAFLKTLSGRRLANALGPELRIKINSPIHFTRQAGDTAHGYEASVLIDLCTALIDARPDLLPSQQFLSDQAEIIVRSAAKVGIVALIDEATGFIDDKRRFEYRELWQHFINENYRQWEAEFPKDLFDLIYKLYGLRRINPKSTKHPRFFGKVLRKYIYQPLANSNGAILEELEELNPVVYANGGRRLKLFQFLSEDVGIPALRQHIWQVVGIGRSVQTKEQFDRAFYSAFPQSRPVRPGETMDLFEDLSS
jgi:hypothetical protein